MNLLCSHRTDARGILTTYVYDNIDRPTSITYADGTPSVSYTYDQNGYTGFLTTASNSLKTTTFTYNAGGQVATEQSTITGVTGTFTASYSYDRDGRITRITYPSGRLVQRSYQASGGTATDRINTIVDTTTSNTLVANVQDNPAGLVTNRTLSGITESRSFNTRNQLTGISATAGSSLLSLTYDYGTTNNIGRIRTRTDALQPEHSVNYTYDAMNRLTQAGAANGSWSVGWILDAWGNRTVQTPSGLATSRVGSQTLGYLNNRNTLLSYDNDGNVTNDGLHSYTYDAEGRITTVDGGAVTFGYDTEGRRLKKTANSETTYFMYGQTGLMSEFSTTNTNAAQAASTDRLKYFVSEQTGTPVLALTGGGTVLENNRVLPFGELWNPESGSPNDQKFTSYIRDLQTSLDYAMARYHTPSYGRFMSPDPLLGHAIDPQSWNGYTYTLNDPINYVDPSGLCTVVNGRYVDDEGNPCPLDPNTTVTVTTSPPPPSLSPWDFCTLFPSACGRSGPTVGPTPETVTPPPSIRFDTANNGPQTRQQQMKRCVSNFYNSKLGKAVQFGSPLALLPSWNPHWGENLKEWGIAIIGKLGGLFGSGAMSGTTQLTTLRGTVTVGSKLELGTEVALGAVEKVAWPAMAGATVGDIMAHGTCAMMADSAAANAALQSIP